MLHLKDLLDHRRIPRDFELVVLYNGIIRCINGIPVINMLAFHSETELYCSTQFAHVHTI